MKILYVEDDAADFRLIQRMVAGVPTLAGETELVWAQDLDAALAAEDVDVYLVDYGLGSCDGLELVRALVERHSAPVILLTGNESRDVDVAAMNAGAVDCLIKGHIGAATLERSLRYALSRRREEKTSSHLAAIVEASSDAMISTTREGSVQAWNPGAELIFGYAPKDIVGRDLSLVFDPALGGAVDALQQVIQDGTRLQNLETRARCRDGRGIDVSLSISPIGDGSARVKGAALVARDVTQRKEAEASLRQSELNFRAVFENAVDALVILDDEARFVVANQAACDLYELPRDNLLGRGVGDFAVDPDGDDQWRIFQVSERRRAGLVRLKTLDGTVKTVEYSAAAAYLPGRHLVSMRDVTERQEAVRALRVSEERFHAFMQNSPAAAWLTDAEGRMVYVNAATCELTGIKAEQFQEMRQAELFSESEAHSFSENDRSVRDTGNSMEFVEMVPSVDGTLHEWMVFKFPVRDSAGTLLVGGMGVDVHARNKLEAQLRQSLKMEAVGRLAGGIAHDFNNLLTVINGYAELLMYRADLESPVKLALEEIKVAGERAAGLTGQLLAFSRQKVVKQERLHLGEVVSRVEKMLRRLIREDIELRILGDVDLWPILADASQMEQVLLNLAVNARDAMPSGGLLTIETRNQSSGAFPGFVRLTVSDSGEGMGPETLAHLFEPFYTTKTEGKGTGLGLATVYGIVESCGGQVQVESEPDRGTRFDIFLPPAAAFVEPTAATDTALAEAGPSRGSETILLVEDEPQVRRVTRTVLEELGYTVVEARDGADGLNELSHYPGRVDLLLTDVVMPHMSGWDLAIRAREMRPEVKVLYMSGYTDDARLRRGVSTSTASHIEKPFNRKSLSLKVREVLEKETPATQLSDRRA